MHRLIVLFALCAACVPTSYAYTPSTKGEVPRQVGPNGCEFTVLQAPPDEAFEEVGIFKHYNGDLPKQEADLKTALGSRVCEVGADAVVVGTGFKSATAIKYPKGSTPK